MIIYKTVINDFILLIDLTGAEGTGDEETCSGTSVLGVSTLFGTIGATSPSIDKIISYFWCSKTNTNLCQSVVIYKYEIKDFI